MELIHTSPSEIKKITNTGLFDDCLFFSATEYAMGSVGAIYSIEISDEKIIDVSDLHDDSVIESIMNVLSVQESTAEMILSGQESVFDHGKDAEDDWWIQAKQGECAKKMGYEACEAEDEQGTVYIVPMLNRENDLKRVV